MLLISLKNLIKKYTEVENYETSVQAIRAVIRAKCLGYSYEVEQADMEAEQMAVLVHVCESMLVADSSAYVLVHRTLPGKKLGFETTKKVSASFY